MQRMTLRDYMMLIAYYEQRDTKADDGGMPSRPEDLMKGF